MSINVHNLRVYNMTVGAGSSGGEGGGGGFVTSGLVFHYDVGDTSSYSGTGGTINDLSGNGNHGTLSGTYNSAGTSSYISSPAISSPGLANYAGEAGANWSFTHSGWYKFNSFPNGTDALREFINTDTGGNPKNFIIGFWETGTSSSVHRGSLRLNVGTRFGYLEAVKYNFNNLVTSSTWFNIAFTADASDKVILYINGVEEASTNSNGIELGNGSLTTDVTINSSRAYSWLNFAQSAYYSTVLSASEITQNFDALKSRYGY